MSAGRRGPWLSGLMVALAGAVWMLGQVVGAVVSMAADVVTHPLPPAPPSAVSFDGTPIGPGR